MKKLVTRRYVAIVAVALAVASALTALATETASAGVQLNHNQTVVED